jgi:hypothetical protein
MESHILNSRRTKLAWPVARCRRHTAVLYRNPSDRPMVMRPVASVIAISILIAALLLGCGASPRENFYTLHSLSFG